MAGVRQGFACRVLAAVVFGGLAPALPATAADLAESYKQGRIPVYRCDIGGFVELPGTDICLKIGGFARFDISALDNNWVGTNLYEVRNIAVDGYTVPPSGVVPVPTTSVQDDLLQMYGQGRMNVDARMATDYGTVRAFVEGQATDNETNTGNALDLRHAFVQLGGWLFGKTWSTFINPAFGRIYSDPYFVVGDNSQSIRRSQVRYTRELTGGFSVALAIEDQNYNTPPAAIVGLGLLVPIVNPAATALSVVNDRNDMPDLVAALKWENERIGVVQLSGALHQDSYVETQTIGGATVNSFADDDIGFAVSLGAALKVPPDGDDAFAFIATYTDGASQYLPNLYGSSTEIVWGRCGIENCILDNVKKWAVFSTFTHTWSETLSTIIGGGYGQSDYGAAGTALGPTGVPDALNVTSIDGFATLVWKPVRHTIFKFDVHYAHIDYEGFDINPVAAGIQDAQGAWAGTFEITKNF